MSLLDRIRYDRWIGTEGENPQVIIEIKHLVHLLGCRIDLHKISRADLPGQYHSHPAYAIRLILWSGYVEQVYQGAQDDEKTSAEMSRLSLITWAIGRFGLVSPHFIHRIASLLDGPSYSLWIRGPIIAPIVLLGWGWPDHLRGRSAGKPELKED